MPILQIDSASISNMQITGSLIVTSSVVFTGSFGNTNTTLTGSLLGNASFATAFISASFITASNVFGPFGSNSVTSSSFSITSSFSNTTDFSFNGYSIMSRIYADLGGTVKYDIGFDNSIINATQTTTLTTTDAYRMYPLYIPENTTLTGVKWLQTSPGTYTTTSAYSGISLYSISSSGNLILIASCSSKPNMWTTGGLRSESFVSSVNVVPGVYYAAIYFAASSTVTNPVLQSYVSANGLLPQIVGRQGFFIYGSELRPYYSFGAWSQVTLSSSLSITTLFNNSSPGTVVPVPYLGFY